jgi:hypothetical protein
MATAVLPRFPADHPAHLEALERLVRVETDARILLDHIEDLELET